MGPGPGAAVDEVVASGGPADVGADVFPPIPSWAPPSPPPQAAVSNEITSATQGRRRALTAIERTETPQFSRLATGSGFPTMQVMESQGVEDSA